MKHVGLITEVQHELAPGDMIGFVTQSFAGPGLIVSVHPADGIRVKRTQKPALKISVFWDWGCHEHHKDYYFDPDGECFNAYVIYPILVGGVSYEDPRKFPETAARLMP